jgi:hypothetical protein
MTTILLNYTPIYVNLGYDDIIFRVAGDGKGGDAL